MPRKLGTRGQMKVSKVMREFKHGSLTARGGRKKVTSRKQAVAIALSQGRKISKIKRRK